VAGGGASVVACGEWMLIELEASYVQDEEEQGLEVNGVGRRGWSWRRWQAACPFAPCVACFGRGQGGREGGGFG
jgi:hypothetical protein